MDGWIDEVIDRHRHDFPIMHPLYAKMHIYRTKLLILTLKGRNISDMSAGVLSRHSGPSGKISSPLTMARRGIVNIRAGS